MKTVGIATLVPHPRNAEHRTITDEEREGLRMSIIEGSTHHEGCDCYRLDTSITVNKKGNRILGGHRRVEVLLDLGQDFIHEDDITWVTYEPDSEDELACVVKLNNPHLAGRYEGEGLSKVLTDIGTTSDAFKTLRFDALAEELKVFEDAVDADEVATPLDPIDLPPPAMGWCLIGIEVERWGEVADKLKAISEISGVMMEASHN